MEIKKLIRICYFMGIIALFLGVFCRVTICKADETTTQSSTEIFTESEEQVVNQLLNEGGLTPEQHEQLLQAGRRFLESNQLATSTDAVYDDSDYLTFDKSYQYFNESVTNNQALSSIYRLLLSIRNLLVMLICGLVIIFVHNSIKKIISRITKGGIK